MQALFLLKNSSYVIEFKDLFLGIHQPPPPITLLTLYSEYHKRRLKLPPSQQSFLIHRY